MKKDEPIVLKEVKHKKLRLILTILCAFVAISSFIYGIYSCSKINVEAGLQKIDLNEINISEGVSNTPFYDEISFYYDVQATKSMTLTENYKTIKENYNRIIQTAYLLTNEKYQYKTANIATINASINEYVTVDERLFQILKNAYLKSNGNYSVFSGRIQEIWTNNYSTTIYSKNTIDPVLISQQKNYLEKVISILNQKEEYDLLFDEKELKVQLKLSENCYDENHDPYIQLDLNILKHAYVLEMIADYFIYAGYTNGYLISKQGYKLSLGGTYTYTGKDTFNIYRPVTSNYRSDVIIGSVSKDGKVRNVMMGDYQSTIYQPNIYSFQHNDMIYYRHPYYNVVDGYPHNYMRGVMCLSPSSTLFDLAYESIQLLNSPLETAKEWIKERFSNTSYFLIQDNGKYDNQEEELAIYYKSNIQDITFATINEISIGTLIS